MTTTRKRRRKVNVDRNAILFMPKTYVDSVGFNDEFEVYANGDLYDKALSHDWHFVGIGKQHFVFRRDPIVVPATPDAR